MTISIELGLELGLVTAEEVEQDEFRAKDKLYNIEANLPKEKKTHIDFVLVDRDFEHNGYTTDLIWVFFHHPSGRFFSLSADSSSWADDQCLGEGSYFIEVFPYEKKVRKWATSAELAREEAMKELVALGQEMEPIPYTVDDSWSW